MHVICVCLVKRREAFMVWWWNGGRSQSYRLDLHIFVCTLPVEAEAQNTPSWAEAVKIPLSGNLKHWQ